MKNIFYDPFFGGQGDPWRAHKCAFWPILTVFFCFWGVRVRVAGSAAPTLSEARRFVGVYPSSYGSIQQGGFYTWTTVLSITGNRGKGEWVAHREALPIIYAPDFPTIFSPSNTVYPCKTLVIRGPLPL